MIVVIPAYEPDEKLLRVVAELKRDTDYAIVVVNDGSSEAAEPVFAALPEGVTLLRHAQNRGKGRALKTAYEYIAAHFPQSEGIVTVDADGQHLPADVVRVSEDWEAHPEALVLGSRRFTGTVPWRSRRETPLRAWYSAFQRAFRFMTRRPGFVRLRFPAFP